MSAKKVAIVTGSSRGIGRGIAVELAQHGWYIVINYRSNREAAEEAGEQIKAAGSEALLVKADMACGADLDALVDATLEHGSPNITSPNKQIILIISIADFLTSNIDLYTDNPLPMDLIQDVVKQTTISPAVLENFSDRFLEQMKTDAHFQECQSLIAEN